MIVAAFHNTQQYPEETAAAIAEVLRAHGPMTRRLLFYHLVSRGLIEKSKAEFSKLCACCWELQLG